MDVQATLRDLVAGRRLPEAEAEDLFERLLTGRLEDAQIGAVLALIAARGPSVEELVGAARAMRRHVQRVPVPDPPTGLRQVVVDTCGTGGAAKTFNVSTAAALVVAGASPHHAGGDLRVLVAKHGNRSRSGRGSAEVLATLGVNVDAPPAVQARCLEQAGVCFCFAIHHHPAMRHAAGARRALGFPTIFNLLGPMTNPAGATHQLMGVYDPAYVGMVGHVLLRLGTTAAMVVHGAGGMDEISTLGPTICCRVHDGHLEATTMDAAAELGLRCDDAGALQVRDVHEAASRVRDVLAGMPGPCRDIVVLNAAATLHIAGAAADLREGCMLAEQAIASGQARQTLDTLVRVSNAPP